MGNWACSLWLCTMLLYFSDIITWAEFVDRLLNFCLCSLSLIAAAKSLLNKKADVKVRCPPDRALFFFFFSEICQCLCCRFPSPLPPCQCPYSWCVSLRLIVTTSLLSVFDNSLFAKQLMSHSVCAKSEWWREKVIVFSAFRIDLYSFSHSSVPSIYK